MPASEDYGPLSALKQYLDYRPLGNDPWTNTMRGTAPAPGQGFAPAGADPVLYPTASPLVNITEGDIKRATDVGLAASGSGLKGQQIKAYHSSPHDFMPEPGYPLGRFDLSKIGTGEGAQVYGHGAYLSENPAVSGQGGKYWDQFLSRFRGDERAAASRLWASNFDRDAATQTAQRVLDDTREALRTGVYPEPARFGPSRDKYEAMARQQQQQLDMLKSGKPVGPRTYEVNINADPAHMLDWDKPLRSQSPEVVEGLQRAMNPRQWEAFNAANAGTAMRQGFIGSDLRTASDKIFNAGIPGIRYLDRGSRGAGTGSSNYVVRDPTLLDIVKKYGLAGLAAPPAIAGAMNQERQP